MKHPWPPLHLNAGADPRRSSNGPDWIRPSPPGGREENVQVQRRSFSAQMAQATRSHNGRLPVASGRRTGRTARICERTARPCEVDVSDLREELAKRLYDSATHQNWTLLKDNPSPPWDKSGSISREWWRNIADECIRQMEWARRERSLPLWKYSSDQIDNVIVGWVPLTLAPPDWQPCQNHIPI